MDKALQYDVLADKEGYVLAKEDGDKITFRAFQLGKVAVKVCNRVVLSRSVNPIAPRKAKIAYSFGLSEGSRVNILSYILSNEI